MIEIAALVYIVKTVGSFAITVFNFIDGAKNDN